MTARTLTLILIAQQPFNYVIIILGKNDMKAKFDRSAVDIADGVMQPVEIVEVSGASPAELSANQAPEVTVICPLDFGNRVNDTRWTKFEEWRGGWKKSRILASIVGCSCHAQ